MTAAGRARPRGFVLLSRRFLAAFSPQRPKSLDFSTFAVFSYLLQSGLFPLLFALHLPLLQRSRTAAQRAVLRLLAGTRSAVRRKRHKPPTRARRRGSAVLPACSTCVLHQTGVFLPCRILGQLLHLPVIVLLERCLNRPNCETQISVPISSVFRCNGCRFGDDQAAFFQRPDVLANRVRTQVNRFTDFSVAWPALECLAILAEQQVGVDRDFRCAQTQRENFFRQWEVVLDRIARRP